MPTDKQMPEWINAVAAKLETANADVGRSYDNRPDAEETAQIIYAGWQAHAESQKTRKDIIEEALSGTLPSCRCLCSFCKSGKHCKICPCANAESVAPKRCKHGVWAADHCYKCEAESLSGAAPRICGNCGLALAETETEEQCREIFGDKRAREEGAQAHDVAEIICRMFEFNANWHQPAPTVERIKKLMVRIYLTHQMRYSLEVTGQAGGEDEDSEGFNSTPSRYEGGV